MLVFQVPKDSKTLLVNDVENLLGIASGASYMISNGHVVPRSQPLQHGCIYYIFPRVLGGKGGFGSMLRAIGAQIEKTTSREACRDLSGRRIRDVNNEKKLKDWVSKQAEREQEKQEREERRRAKRAKYLEDSPPRMDDPEFEAQYSQIMENAKMAMQEGLAKMKEGGPTSRKRKAEATLDKYSDRWSIIGGVSADDLDSDSGSENSDSNDARPSTSSDHPSHTISSSSSASPSASLEGAASTSAAAPGSSAASATVTSSSEAPDAVGDAPPCKLAKLEASATTDDASSSSQQAEASDSGATASEGADTTSKESETSSGAVSNPLECTDPVDLDDFTCAEDLQALGLERLKADLMRRGLKCGGSLQERAQRLFSVKGLSVADIPAKLLAKGKGQGKSSQK